MGLKVWPLPTDKRVKFKQFGTLVRGVNMNRNPHRLPDLFYSLVPPILLFAALDTLLGTHYFSQPYWPSYYYLVFIGAAFAAEQLMTVVSGWVFRGFILGLVLGYPSRNLFEHGARGFLGMLFP